MPSHFQRAAGSNRTENLTIQAIPEVEALKRSLRLNTRHLDESQGVIFSHMLRHGGEVRAHQLYNEYLRKAHSAITLTNLVVVGSYLGALTKKETRAVLQSHSLSERIRVCKPFTEACRQAIRSFSDKNSPTIITDALLKLPHVDKKSPYKLIIYTALALKIISGQEALIGFEDYHLGRLTQAEMQLLETKIRRAIKQIKKRLQEHPRAATLSLGALRTPFLAERAPHTLFT